MAGAAGSAPTYNNNAGSWGSGLSDSGVTYVPPDAGSLGEGTTDAGGACGASTMAATEVVVEETFEETMDVVTTKPLTLYIMLDQSFSMALGNLWTPAVSALTSFVKADATRETGVGIQYFPNSSISACDGSGYSTPDVAIKPAATNAAAIVTSLGKHSPSGLGTPIEGALNGVTSYCISYQKSHPDEQCVAVLVTDGEPNGCSSNTTTLANIATKAKAAGVITVAVGLSGADFKLLDAISKAGGAPDCDTTKSAYACDVSAGADKLGDALSKIRDTVVTTVTETKTVQHTEYTKLSCAWEIPAKSNDGMSFDPDKVNIQLTTGGKATTLLRADAPNKCQNNTWYYEYDAAGVPTRFMACPEVCTTIEAATDAKIDVLLGCETLVPELF